MYTGLPEPNVAWWSVSNMASDLPSYFTCNCLPVR